MGGTPGMGASGMWRLARLRSAGGRPPGWPWGLVRAARLAAALDCSCNTLATSVPKTVSSILSWVADDCKYTER